ncbi:MAG: hypothetical protein KatS3mg087_0875 [Patescibacteria group bacterium]|nr:MAG: hypothetical protein KatS3mg087_0875 [Patescibacteria group bacterium]
MLSAEKIAKVEGFKRSVGLPETASEVAHQVEHHATGVRGVDTWIDQAPARFARLLKLLPDRDRREAGAGILRLGVSSRARAEHRMMFEQLFPDFALVHVVLPGYMDQNGREAHFYGAVIPMSDSEKAIVAASPDVPYERKFVILGRVEGVSSARVLEGLNPGQVDVFDDANVRRAGDQAQQYLNHILEVRLGLEVGCGGDTSSLVAVNHVSGMLNALRVPDLSTVGVSARTTSVLHAAHVMQRRDPLLSMNRPWSVIDTKDYPGLMVQVDETVADIQMLSVGSYAARRALPVAGLPKVTDVELYGLVVAEHRVKITDKRGREYQVQPLEALLRIVADAR